MIGKPVAKSIVGYAVAAYVIFAVSYAAFKPQRPTVINYLPNLNTQARAPEGSFRAPFHFNDLDIPPSSPDKPFLVGNLLGSGVVRSVAFHSGFFGIAVGYRVDGGALIWINNGHCLHMWDADSPSAVGMPVTLLAWRGEYDLSIAVNTPIEFKRSFGLYFCNSDRRPRPISSLHVYGYFKGLASGPGNMLRF